MHRMTSAPDTEAVPADGLRLLRGANLGFALGAVALVTLSAFENRAVGTALPSIVKEFHAVSAFGVVNAAPAASYIVSLALTGLWADRRGPVPPLRLGAVTFALAQVLVGTATSMPTVVAGRLLSGLAEGLLDIALMVLVARQLHPRLRPRMFSLFAGAWVLPSVLGPLLTGVVTEHAGWRHVFLGALVLLVPTWLMLRPAVGRERAAAGDRPRSSDQRSVPGWAAAAGAGVFGLTLAGESLAAHRLPALAAVLVSAALLGTAIVHLVPRGTLRADCGLPSVVAVRALTGASFGGVGAFLPLLLTLLHGFGPSSAGVSLSVTGVMWAVGSFIQGRDHGLPRLRVLQVGLTLISIGLLGTTLLTVPTLPAWVGLACWALAGVGMGLSSSSLSVLTLDLSADEDQGRNNGAAQIASSASMAIAFAAGGSVLAFAAPHPGPAVFAMIVLGGAVAALLGTALSGRVVPCAPGRDGATRILGGTRRMQVAPSQSPAPLTSSG